ncbi:hypothetical protein BDV96DRAFT_583385 [Lophiotrema nucula]|uniref:Uncharacterized protein n=1 Tax=Lophiotrema nucula TaxID=690887 RepID=A0A6A5YWS7_9PLEO|nr:hypothetical protein BDV96DRAFT_583385 [Lophiotrema nucula]
MEHGKDIANAPAKSCHHTVRLRRGYLSPQTLLMLRYSCGTSVTTVDGDVAADSAKTRGRW